MDKPKVVRPLSHEEFVSEIVAELEDPIHKRIVQACTKDDPLNGMEAELARILLEAIDDED